ncbi:hypothetical protein M5D96_008385 [Drosophila gunungcola]|uniref:Uncharacterized protein n=1 Tax=Drosophila gunungcola TaxID=103775 RepID=A0A9P9YK88_9MUSC|nr:hypothetical protein M5D96_008385 [Drosophila gunungcola]
MAWLLVNVQLEILIVDQEAAALLVDGEVGIVALRQQVHVVAMRQLGLHLDAGLPMNVGSPLRVDVAPVALLAALAQASLHLGTGGLQIMVHHIEVGEGRKLAIWRQKGNCKENRILEGILRGKNISRESLPKYFSLRDVACKRSPTSMPSFWHTDSIMRFILDSKLVELSITSK